MITKINSSLRKLSGDPKTTSSVTEPVQLASTLDIVPFRSGYHALLGRTAFARFNAVPHYVYLKLKMPGPRGVITVNGKTERSLRTEEHTATLAAEAQSSLLRQTANLAIKPLDTSKRVRSNLQQDRLAGSELA